MAFFCSQISCCFSLTRITFSRLPQLIQDHLPITRSLIWSHLQSPFCPMRSHIHRFQGFRCGHPGGGIYSAYHSTPFESCASCAQNQPCLPSALRIKSTLLASWRPSWALPRPSQPLPSHVCPLTRPSGINIFSTEDNTSFSPWDFCLWHSFSGVLAWPMELWSQPRCRLPRPALTVLHEESSICLSPLWSCVCPLLTCSPSWPGAPGDRCRHRLVPAVSTVLATGSGPEYGSTHICGMNNELWDLICACLLGLSLLWAHPGPELPPLQPESPGFQLPVCVPFTPTSPGAAGGAGPGLIHMGAPRRPLRMCVQWMSGCQVCPALSLSAGKLLYKEAALLC